MIHYCCYYIVLIITTTITTIIITITTINAFLYDLSKILQLFDCVYKLYKFTWKYKLLKMHISILSTFS